MMDLPPIRTPEPVWSEFADQCRQEAGQWFLLGEQLSRSTAWHIQAGRYAAFRPAGTFEASARNTHGSRGDVYVRFLGKRTRR